MKSQNQENLSLPTGIMLYRFNGVPIVAQPDFWPAPVLLTGLLAWVAGLRKPERSLLQRLGVGLLAMSVALFADIGHAMAHTISARLAGAPMDEILLSSGMPRTLYANNALPPQTHIRRSLGGPIFSLIGFTLSLLWRRMSPDGSLSHDLGDARIIEDHKTFWRLYNLISNVFPSQFGTQFFSIQIAVQSIMAELLAMLCNTPQRIIDLADQQVLAIIQAAGCLGSGFHAPKLTSFLATRQSLTFA